MIRKIFLVTSFVAIALSFMAFTQVGKTKLKVKIDNITTVSGTIYVSIFNQNGFPEKGEQLLLKKVKVTAKTSEMNFELPAGNYAIALYHDVNDNNQMDKNFFGYPLEPYAFSRNYEPVLSAPDFADCKFTLTASAKVISISLIQ